MTRLLSVIMLALCGCSTVRMPPGAETTVITSAPEWKSFQDYLKHVTQRVQGKWESLMIESRKLPPPGTTVEIVFVMNADGRIARIKDVNESDPLFARLCVAAIANAAPFRAWTPEMKALLHEEQEMTFRFEFSK